MLAEEGVINGKRRPKMTWRNVIENDLKASVQMQVWCLTKLNGKK